MSARRGTQFVPIGTTTICFENLSRKNHENVVYQKLKHLDDEYLCLESECSFAKYEKMESMGKITSSIKPFCYPLISYVLVAIQWLYSDYIPNESESKNKICKNIFIHLCMVWIHPTGRYNRFIDTFLRTCCAINGIFVFVLLTCLTECPSEAWSASACVPIYCIFTCSAILTWTARTLVDIWQINI